MILIEQPEINPDPLQYFSCDSGGAKDFVTFHLNKQNIDPQSSPKIIDLCSGAGGIAKIFIDLGWKPEDITCVDKLKPEKPVVNGVRWIYADLFILGDFIKRDNILPKEIAELANSFNIVSLSAGFMGEKLERSICNFFVKPEGIVIASSSYRTELDLEEYRSFIGYYDRFKMMRDQL